MTCNKILLVMDASPKFLGNDCRPEVTKASPQIRAQILTNIKSAILAAQKQGFFIIIVEFDNDETHPEILALIRSYERAARWVKYKMNQGATCVRDALAKYKVVPSEIYICGSIFEWCIRSTIHGLRHEFYPNVPITVIRNATLTQNADEPEIQRWARLTGTGLLESLDDYDNSERIFPNNTLPVEAVPELLEMTINLTSSTFMGADTITENS